MALNEDWRWMKAIIGYFEIFSSRSIRETELRWMKAIIGYFQIFSSRSIIETEEKHENLSG
jgi:hypothetical protein